jgi:predicted O-methyltransferase YrrM
MPRHTRHLIKIFDECGLSPTAGAEVGVRFGKNARGLLVHYPNLGLLLVDNYHNAKHVEKKAKAFLNTSCTWGELIWIKKTSVEAAKIVEDCSLDFVFIDANHSYKSVKEDIEAWLPKVRVGGLLTGHDYSNQFPGVVRAVKERFEGSFYVSGDVWWTRVGKV